jgi:hypothetical protein
MGKLLGSITGILVIAIFLVRIVPFIPLETKVEWITYIGLILMFITGGTAFSVVKNALIGVIVGAITFAIIMGFLQSMPK